MNDFYETDDAMAEAHAARQGLGQRRDGRMGPHHSGKEKILYAICKKRGLYFWRDQHSADRYVVETYGKRGNVLFEGGLDEVMEWCDAQPYSDRR